MEMKFLYKLIPFFAFFMLLAPSTAVAIPCDQNCNYVWHGIFGFDTSLITTNNVREIIIQVIIPAGSFFFIFLGVARAIGIHRNMGNIEYAIAAFVMLAMLFTGGLGAINTYLLVALGQFAFWAYALVFGVGVVFWVRGSFRRFQGEGQLAISYRNETRRLENSLANLNQQLEHVQGLALQAEQNNQFTNAQHHRVRADEIRAQIRQEEERLTRLRSTYRMMP